MNKLGFQPPLNYYTAAMICNPANGNGRAFLMACHDRAFPPGVSNPYSRIVDALPHNLHSIMATFSADHVRWYIVGTHMRTAISGAPNEINRKIIKIECIMTDNS